MTRVTRIDALDIRGRVALSTVAQAVGNGLTAVISIAVLHLATGHLGPTRYGYLTTVVAIVAIFSLLADLGLTTITARDIAVHPEDAATILGDNLAFRICLSLVAMPMISALAYLLYPTERSTVVLGVMVMSVDLVLNAVSNTSLMIFAARTRSDVIALTLFVGKVVYLGAVVVSTVLRADLFFYLGAYLAGDLVAATVAVALLVRRVRIRLRFDPQRWWIVLRRSFPLGVMQVIGNIYLWTGSICLSLFRSPSDVAFYGLCTGFIITLTTISGYFMGSLIPTLATADRATAGVVVQKAWDVMVFLGLPVLLGAVLLRRPLVVAVAGPRFAQAATPFAVLGGVALLMYLNNVFTFSSIALDSYRVLLLVQAPSVAMQVVLNLVLVPHLGVTGASVAILCSESCSLTAAYLVFRRRSRIAVRLRSSLRPVAAAGLVGAIGFAVRAVWSTGSPVVGIVVGATIVSSLYLAVAVAFRCVPAEISGARVVLGRMAVWRLRS